MSFQIYPEAAKKATELTKTKLQETQVEKVKKTGSLFEGVDLDKIARESALKANERFKEEEQKFFKELEAETEKLKVSDR